MRNDLPAPLARLLPFPSRFVQVGGQRLHVLEAGAGDPVVMVHGNPTWSFYYRNLLRALAPSHRVLAFDHVGCGLSDKPDDAHYPYRLERRVEDMDGLLDQLGVSGRITLLLHDWGGMIGMAWASRRPERVARLVLLNTAAFGLPPGKRLPWQLWLIRKTPLGPLLVRGLNAFSLGLVSSCVVRPLDPDVRAGYLYPYRNWADRRAVLRFVQDIPLVAGDPGHERIRQVDAGLGRFRQTPTLICWGGRDFVFDDAFLAGWRERLPEAEVHRFADAGHLVLEDAGERIVPLIHAFFSRHPLPPS